jgi:hypothetical protein
MRIVVASGASYGVSERLLSAGHDIDLCAVDPIRDACEPDWPTLKLAEEDRIHIKASRAEQPMPLLMNRHERRKMAALRKDPA